MTSHKLFSVSWTCLSITLLLIYLLFFHSCLLIEYPGRVAMGAVCWLTWCGVCWRWRKIFYNRFEYWIHQIVGIDILLEALNPIHQGYGFYWCAASFWLVFIAYHVSASVKGAGAEMDGAEPAKPNAGVEPQVD